MVMVLVMVLVLGRDLCCLQGRGRLCLLRYSLGAVRLLLLQAFDKTS